MLVGLAGHLSSFNGAYDYPSGGIYPDHVPYYSMRVLLAIPGIAMVPLAWGTAVELGMTMWSSHLVTLMVLLGEFRKELGFDTRGLGWGLIELI